MRPRYINWNRSRDLRQRSGSSSTMKIKILFTIVACSGLLLVHGLDSTVSYANGTADSSRRIINGETVNPADFPFLVQIWYSKEGKTNLCSGSIITDHFILTAAHCLFGKQCNDLQIFPATWQPNDEPTIHAIECFPHELFKYNKFDYDIGLVETQEDLLVGGKSLIPLPDPDKEYPPGYPGIILGWGFTETGEFRKHLKRGDVEVYDWNDCNKDFQGAGSCTADMTCPVANIPSHAMCTIGIAPKFSASCWGDSGGPCIIDGVIAGVLSGTVVKLGECETRTPSLLMNVAKFVHWFHRIPELRRDMYYGPFNGKSF